MFTVAFFSLQGDNFFDMLKMMQPEHLSAMCSLVASIKRCVGLWRLQEVPMIKFGEKKLQFHVVPFLDLLLILFFHEKLFKESKKNSFLEVKRKEKNPTKKILGRSGIIKRMNDDKRG